MDLYDLVEIKKLSLMGWIIEFSEENGETLVTVANKDRVEKVRSGDVTLIESMSDRYCYKCMNITSIEINRNNYESCKLGLDIQDGNSAQICVKYFSREDFYLYEKVEKIR